TAALIACSAPPTAAPEPWEVVAGAVHTPVGSTAPGALRCALSGQACAPLLTGARLEEDAQIQVAAGARATLDLGGDRRFALEGEARVSLHGMHGGAPPQLALEQGFAEIDTGAPEAGGHAYGLSASGTALAIDPATPARVAFRSVAGGCTTLLVKRGRLTIGAGAEALSLRAGEAAILSPGQAPTRTLGATIALDREGAGDESAASEEGPSGAPPRGLGTMSARVPGTAEIVSGVTLLSHKVHVVIHDGFARTEVEEVFQNDTPRVLEGRYLFPVPPDASVSRLALWVGEQLVEGEIVERGRAERIFKGIVDDSVRPRDPALLEWVRGSEVSLRVFPLPPKGSRKLILAYDQVLDRSEGRARYLYPLALGADRAVKVDDFSIDLTAFESAGALGEPRTPGYAATIKTDAGKVEASFSARRFTPAADFVLSFAAGAESAITAYRAPPRAKAKKGEAPASEAGFVALRIPVRWPEGAAPPASPRRDRAIVIDASQSQSAETLAGEADLAARLLRDLDPDERFVLLACDSACAAYPEDGLASPNEGALHAAEAWLRAREPGGASDLAGALVAAAKRLAPSVAGQIVYLGDGAVSAGELSVATIAARVRPEIEARALDLRLFGAGRSVDETTLAGLGRALGAPYEQVSTGLPLAQRAAQIALGLRAPLLTDAALEFPASVTEVYPRALPPLRVGQELLVVARATPGEGGAITLRGTLGDAPCALRHEIAWAPEGADERVAPRLWAAAKIADLEASNDPLADKQILALSTTHHVLSRRTALLVLENDRMFAEFGIPRTQAASAGPAASGAGLSSDRAGQIARELSQLDLGLVGASSAPGPSGALNRFAEGDLPLASPPRGSVGGLGLSGVGEGGGGQGFGSGHGMLGPIGDSGSSFAVKSPTPRVQLGAISVSGRLPPEVVQRVVRQSAGRARRCYENGLRRDPTLAGRVVVRFLILANGEVGSAADAGSSLGDPGVIACVVRTVQGLTFPAPEGGAITVTYPITFAPEGGTAPTPASIQLQRPTILPEGPSATHQAGDEAWRTQGEDALEKLRQALRENDRSRQRHEALIRGLLVRGRFPEALAAARRFATIDPDLPRARELLAYAAAAEGEGELARTAVDAQVEDAPTSVDLHQRAARAFEAAGDERRACAHFRSLFELTPSADEARFQAFRCRARLGEREAAQREAASLDKPGPLLTQLLTALGAGAAPAWDGGRQTPGQLEASIRCADGVESCPIVAVLTPSGAVISPWTPASARNGAGSAALSDVPEGRYRTLLIGGAPDARGELTLRAFASRRTFPVARGGLQTLALTTVTSPALAFGGRW
ncbi:MAG: AgmX/PglI C-terminal domain-containing protein, partial [Minicystis sp.]